MYSFGLISAYKCVNLCTDSPGCSYCQELAPEYAEAARQLKEEQSEIWLAKVDTKEETELAKNYSIEIVPNMTFFSNGIAEKHYTGKLLPTYTIVVGHLDWFL